MIGPYISGKFYAYGSILLSRCPLRRTKGCVHQQYEQLFISISNEDIEKMVNFIKKLSDTIQIVRTSFQEERWKPANDATRCHIKQRDPNLELKFKKRKQLTTYLASHYSTSKRFSIYNLNNYSLFLMSLSKRFYSVKEILTICLNCKLSCSRGRLKLS